MKTDEEYKSSFSEEYHRSTEPRAPSEEQWNAWEYGGIEKKEETQRRERRPGQTLLLKLATVMAAATVAVDSISGGSLFKATSAELSRMHERLEENGNCDQFDELCHQFELLDSGSDDSGYEISDWKNSVSIKGGKSVMLSETWPTAKAKMEKWVKENGGDPASIAFVEVRDEWVSSPGGGSALARVSYYEADPLEDEPEDDAPKTAGFAVLHYEGGLIWTQSETGEAARSYFEGIVSAFGGDPKDIKYVRKADLYSYRQPKDLAGLCVGWDEQLNSYVLVPTAGSDGHIGLTYFGHDSGIFEYYEIKGWAPEAPPETTAEPTRPEPDTDTEIDDDTTTAQTASSGFPAFENQHPADDGYAYLELSDEFGSSYFYFYVGETSENQAPIELLSGMSYDNETNTLTLSDFDTSGWKLLWLERMGTGFTIRLEGDSCLDAVTVSADNYGGSINIVGDGSLTVNPGADKDTSAAIMFYLSYARGALTVGRDAKLMTNAVTSDGDSTVWFIGSQNRDTNHVYYDDTVTSYSYYHENISGFTSETWFPADGR